MSTGSPTSRLIMKVARIVLGADGLELQAVDDLSPPRLGQSDAGDDLSERATIRADERDRSQHGGYSDHQRGRTEPEKAHEQQGKADVRANVIAHDAHDGRSSARMSTGSPTSRLIMKV